MIAFILGLPFKYHHTSRRIDGIRIEKEIAILEATSGP